MVQVSANLPVAALNTACRCSLAEWILLIVALVLLTGIRAWRHRDRSIHGARLAARFAGAWAIGVLGIALVLWWHDRNRPGPLARAALVARANSICAGTDERRYQLGSRILSYFPPNAGSDAAQIFEDEAQAIQSLTPAADVAADWRAVSADVTAQAGSLAAVLRGDVNAPDPNPRIVARGRATAPRLGIRCSVIDT